VGVIQAPTDDTVGVDHDARFGIGYRLGVAADFDAAGSSRVSRAQIVDDDRGPTGGCDIAVLLGGREIPAAHLDQVGFCVRAPHPQRGEVWRAVGAEGGHARQAALVQAGPFGFSERSWWKLPY